MSKILTPFERGLKEKMANYEMPYEQRSWFLLQRSMNGVNAGNYPWIVALIATVLVTSAGSIALYRHNHTPASAYKASTNDRFTEMLPLHAVQGGAVNTDLSSINLEDASLLSLNANASTATISGKQITNPGSTNYSSNSNQTINHQSQISSNSSLTSGESEIENSQNNELSNPASAAILADNVIGFSSNVRKACKGVEVEFDVNNGPKSGSYLWNFGDGHFSDQINPKHKYGKAGDYDVSLSVTSSNGQINTTVMNDMITIQESPDADFIWEFVNSDVQSPTVKIVDLSDNANKYEWTFADGTKSDAQNTVYKLNDHGKQMISLNVINENGCTDAIVKQISVNSDFKLDAPNNFTAGKEVFMPLGLKQSKVNFIMTIFDKSGNKVYETTSRIKGWDGKLPGGSIAEVGSSYDWKIIITNDITREQKYFNGSLTVSP